MGVGPIRVMLIAAVSRRHTSVTPFFFFFWFTSPDTDQILILGGIEIEVLTSVSCYSDQTLKPIGRLISLTAEPAQTGTPSSSWTPRSDVKELTASPR